MGGEWIGSLNKLLLLRSERSQQMSMRSLYGHLVEETAVLRIARVGVALAHTQ